MSTYRGHANLNPNDPMYYAPRWLHERSALRLSPSSEPSSERPRGPVSSSPAFDLLEAPRRPLDPEVIHESPGFVRELDRRVALIRGAGRFAAAVGISALAALFFAIMVQDYARRPDGGASPPSGTLQSVKAAFYQPPRREDDLKPALSQVQTILASPRTSQTVIAHEQSETVLQQFLQWRQKSGSTGAPQ